MNIKQAQLSFMESMKTHRLPHLSSPILPVLINNSLHHMPPRLSGIHMPPLKTEPPFARGAIASLTTPKRKPNQRRIFDVINNLKKLDGQAATTAELFKNSGIEMTDKALIELLQGNPKVTIDESLGYPRFSYKPTYDVRTSDELLDLLIKRPDGIDKTDLEDAYKNVEEDIKMLANTKKILKVRNTDKNTDVLYPNEPRLMLDLFPDFRELWKKVQVPDEADLQQEMVKVGLKKTLEMTKVRQLKRPPPKEKKKRQTKRKMNFHNNHLHDIDLTQSTDWKK